MAALVSFHYTCCRFFSTKSESIRTAGYAANNYEIAASNEESRKKRKVTEKKKGKKGQEEKKKRAPATPMNVSVVANLRHAPPPPSVIPHNPTRIHNIASTSQVHASCPSPLS